MLEPFGTGNLPPVFSIRLTEVVNAKNRWVRVREGKTQYRGSVVRSFLFAFPAGSDCVSR